MFKFLKRLFGAGEDIPDVGLTPREIDINLTPQSQAALRRHAARLSRVFMMPQTADTKTEIKMRQRALTFAGFNAPKTSDDAKRILEQLEVSHGYHT